MVILEKIYVKNIFTNNFISRLISVTCRNIIFLCKPIVQFFIEDYPTNRINYTNLFQDFYHIPAGTSARNINHWVQLYSNKEFRQFDHGKNKNIIIYGKDKPPLYNLEKFKNYSVPSLVTISNSDPFSKPEDCQHLFKHVKKNVIKLLELKDYNHLDYLWSNHATKEVYKKIFEFIK
jgi:esterase/lipase